jgi:hypothetical protein
LKKTIIQFGLIAFLFLCFFIGCKKQETINKIEEEVEMESIVDPKEWFYASKQSRIKQDPLNNIDQINGVAKNSKGLVKEEKLPKWSQKREKTIKNTQIFEYEISYKVMNLFIPSSIKNSSEKKRYGNSIVNKAVFIKKNDGFSLNVISFLPDPEYLKMSGYNTSKYSFIDFDTKYTGAILIYNWNSELIKAYNYKNGKKIGDIKISLETNNSQIKKENPCGIAEPYDQWYRICTGFIVGDVYEDQYCIEGYNQQFNFDYSGCNDTNVPNNTCDDPTTPMNECDQTPEDFVGSSDPSNTTSFKFPENSNYELLYPRFTQLVKSDIKKYVMQNQNIIDALKKFTSLTEDQISSHLTWGKGPTLKIEEIPKTFYGDKPIGKFRPRIDPNTILINKSDVEEFEKLKGFTREAMWFLLAVTVLHEYVHYGDFKFDNIQAQTEVGLEFEYEIFGRYIYDLDDAKQYLEIFYKKK